MGIGILKEGDTLKAITDLRLWGDVNLRFVIKKGNTYKVESVSYDVFKIIDEDGYSMKFYYDNLDSNGEHKYFININEDRIKKIKSLNL